MKKIRWILIFLFFASHLCYSLAVSPRITIRHWGKPVLEGCEESILESVCERNRKRIFGFLVLIQDDFYIGNEFEGDPVFYFSDLKQGIPAQKAKTCWIASKLIDWEYVFSGLYCRRNRIGVYTDNPEKISNLFKQKRRFCWLYLPDKFE